jgi:hypothetical protein
MTGSEEHETFEHPSQKLPHRFIATSRGASATRWICFVLASNPDVFVAHGKHSLESVRRSDFDSERRQDDTISLALGNVMADFYRCRPFAEVFDIYRCLQPDAQACGNVHTYQLEEVRNRFDPVTELEDVRIVNIIRHPVTYIASHTGMAISGRQYPVLRTSLRHGFERALELHPELSDIEHDDASIFEAFVVSCYSAAQWVADLRHRDVPHVKMEALTTDVDRLIWFCEYLTRLPYDRKRLAGFIRGGPINCHRNAATRIEPNEVYAQWEPWQRTAAALVLSEDVLARFAAEGYDVANLEEERRVSSSTSRVVALVTLESDAPGSQSVGQASLCDGPELVELGYRGFNLVRFQKRFFALAQTLGVVHLTQVSLSWFAEGNAKGTVFVADSVLELKRQIDRSLLVPGSVTACDGQCGATAG